VAGSGRNQVTFDRVPLDRACSYAAEDADVTLRLYRALQPRLAAEGMSAVYETIERPLIPVVAAMETRGILVDPDRLASLSRDFAERIAALEVEIHRLAGRSFNIASPKQLGEVLFDELGLPGGRRGKSGSHSTDSAVLEPLAAQGHEIAARILDWRQLVRLKTTYADALHGEIDPRDGRVHTSFSMTGASTGRLASTDPNLQNIPVRTEEGRKIRAAFVAPPGHLLVSVDYSQIELRLIAEMAGVELLKRAFRDGLDVHALTAAEVFGVPADRVTPELRRRAKTINYAIMYGVSGFGLAARLGIDRAEASRYIRQYLDRFHEVADYMERTKSFCRKHGYVTTRFGRRIHIPGINSPDPGRRAGFERQAINAPIQGTAADIIKRAMIAVEPALEAAGLAARMLLQVHDELVFEAPVGEVEATIAVVRRAMEGAADLEVPLLAEAGAGESWATAH
jgi:DNA polymerase-1